MTHSASPTTARKSVTSETANFHFYDIESLNNVFSLCVFRPRENRVDVFYLVDEDTPLGNEIKTEGFSKKACGQIILDRNPAFQPIGDLTRTIVFYDLRNWENNVYLAQQFGLSDADMMNNPNSVSSYGANLRLTCDTDQGYDPLSDHPYLAGYNSYNYDTTILSMYLVEAFATLAPAIERGVHPASMFTPPSAKSLREHNNAMFTEAYKKSMPRYLTNGPVADGKGWDSIPSKVRRNMISSGRHIDVARLNEHQMYTGLKRLLGGMGRQILESENLDSENATIETIADLYELLAYNVSDVIGLHEVFKLPVYSSNFNLRKGLLDEYPETIYEKQQGKYAPAISPYKVRRDRLTPDSSSAKFAGLILSPYGKLPDIPSVSFNYPSERVAQELGFTRVNVLDECRAFFHQHISDPGARAQFEEVYLYYKSIEGKNFNDSVEYTRLYGNVETHVLADIPKRPNNLPYFAADGTPTTCFATFSTGGIHGAEADIAAYLEDLEVWQEQEQRLALVKRMFPDPLVIRTTKGGVQLTDGQVINYTEVLTSKSTIKALKARSEEIEALGPHPSADAIAAINAKYPDIGYKPSKPMPQLFDPNKKDGATKLKPKYAFTSMGKAIHEDFTSYYPNMLRNMSAFFNAELGEDRYAKILLDKDRYGVMMKDQSLSADERARLKVLREGTKLILNAASGAGDMTFGSSPIRMNNAIISMRIIGQLFSWRIGQAQTLAGARIISTNTDGLYSVLDEETNNRVLAEQQALINVEIEPEPLIIVTKDSNNRLELDIPRDPDTPLWEAEIISASGGTLACHAGPQPTKSLAHSAVLDWALARYLRYIVGGFTPRWANEPLSLDQPLDRRLGMELLIRAKRLDDPVYVARLFQNILATSNNTITIPFAADPIDPLNPEEVTLTNPRPLQHYNRMFLVHADKPGAVSLHTAAARKVPPASRARRLREGLSPVQDDQVALEILAANGFVRNRLEASQSNLTLLPEDQDIIVRKIPSIDPTWNIVIDNRDLMCMDQVELRELISCLDLNAYLDQLANVYEKNWMNASNGGENEGSESELE